MRLVLAGLFLVGVSIGSVGGCSRTSRNMTDQERAEISFVNAAEDYLKFADSVFPSIENDTIGTPTLTTATSLQRKFNDLPECRHDKILGLVRGRIGMIHEELLSVGKIKRDIFDGKLPKGDPVFEKQIAKSPDTVREHISATRSSIASFHEMKRLKGE